MSLYRSLMFLFLLYVSKWIYYNMKYKYLVFYLSVSYADCEHHD